MKVSEAEFAYEFVRQRIWDAEDLCAWFDARWKRVFNYAWATSRETALREYQRQGETQ
jgi:hypothetical protein